MQDQLSHQPRDRLVIAAARREPIPPPPARRSPSGTPFPSHHQSCPYLFSCVQLLNFAGLLAMCHRLSNDAWIRLERQNQALMNVSLNCANLRQTVGKLN